MTAGWGTQSSPTPTPWKRDHRAGSIPKGPPQGCPPLPASTSRQEQAPRGAQHCPSVTPRRQNRTIGLLVRGFHHMSSPPWVAKGLMGHILPGAIIQEELPAPAAPLGRKGRAGAREEEGHAQREQHEKTNSLSIVPSCATLKMSLWVPLLFPQPQAGKPDPPCQWGPLPSPHFISSKAKASRVSPQHPQLRRLLPMVRVSRSELEPTGPCPALGVTAERSHPLRLLPARCSASLPSRSGSLPSPRKIFQLFPPSRQQRLCVFSVGEQQLRPVVLEQQPPHPAPRAAVMLMMPWTHSQVSLFPTPPPTQR